MPTSEGIEDVNYFEGDEAWPWKIVDNAGASGGQYIKTANGSGNYYISPPSGKSVKYFFDVDKTGTYKLEALLKAPSGSDNSVWLKVDDGSWVQWHMDVTGSEWD